MLKKSFNWLNSLLSALAFIVPLFIYWQSAARVIQLEDSAEFVTAALTWGIPHPSGYPLYVLLAGLWSQLVGWSPVIVNLLSGLLAALASWLVYKSTRLWQVEPLLALAASWLLAGWTGFWSQSVVAEVYTLYVFLLSAIIYSAARFNKDKIVGWLYLIFGLAGLSASAHLLAVWLWPILLVYYYRDLIIIKLNQKIKVIIFFILGLVPYLYLPWRAAQNPLLNWGRPDSWFSFWYHVLRLGYSDMVWPSGLVNKSGLVGSLLLDLVSDWGLVILVVLILGLIVGYKIYGRTIIFLLTAAVSQILPAVYLRRYGWGLGPAFTYSVYWSGFIMLLAVLFALAATALQNWLAVKVQIFKKSVIIFPIIIFLSLPWSSWYGNFYLFNYSRDNWPEVYASSLLEQLPPQAVLFIWGDDYANDSLLFTIAYQKIVKGLRPDVTVLDGGIIFPILTPNWGEREVDNWLSFWRYAYLTNRPAYATRLPPKDSYLVSRLDGYAYRLFGSLKESVEEATSPNLLLPEVWTINRMFYYSGQDYLAHLLYSQALALWQQDRPRQAQAALREAIYFDNEPFSQDYWRFVKQRNLINQTNKQLNDN